MSTFNDIDIDCLECGETYHGAVWVGIHVGQDPELKDLLLGGELNLVACTECGHVTFHDQFLLYQDPAAELIAYVYPESEHTRLEELHKFMLKGFQDAQESVPPAERKTYQPLLVFGLENLIEMLHKEAEIAEQSQIAQEICKEHQIAIELLRPSEARKRQSVRVLPRSGLKRPPSRQEVLEGIEKLLTLNPALDIYRKLKSDIQADPAWVL
jgi:hypothetical protein